MPSPPDTGRMPTSPLGPDGLRGTAASQRLDRLAQGDPSATDEPYHGGLIKEAVRYGSGGDGSALASWGGNECPPYIVPAHEWQPLELSDVWVCEHCADFVPRGNPPYPLDWCKRPGELGAVWGAAHHYKPYFTDSMPPDAAAFECARCGEVFVEQGRPEGWVPDPTLTTGGIAYDPFWIGGQRAKDSGCWTARQRALTRCGHCGLLPSQFTEVHALGPGSS